MNYRAGNHQQCLSLFDKNLLPKLLENPQLVDFHEEIRPMLDHQSKGDFEQETLGPPTIMGWPFFSHEK